MNNNLEPLTATYGYQAALFQSADFQPPYMNGGTPSANLTPLSSGLVPENRGIFGPLFGEQLSEDCPQNYSVGPISYPQSVPTFGARNNSVQCQAKMSFPYY